MPAPRGMSDPLVQLAEAAEAHNTPIHPNPLATQAQKPHHPQPLKSRLPQNKVDSPVKGEG